MTIAEIQQCIDTDAVIGFLLRNNLSYQEVDDIIQDVWVRLLKYAPRISHVGAARRIFWDITKGLLANYHRNSSNRYNKHVPVEYLDCVSNFTSFCLVRQEESRPDRITERKELELLVQRALFSLQPRYSYLLYLNYFEQLSHSKIAEYLEVPVGTVKTRISKAKMEFKKFALLYGLQDCLDLC